MLIKNLTKNTILATSGKSADHFWSRFKGLMGKKELPEGSSLVLTPCNSIHMFFMKFPLDVVFLDVDFRVVFLVENIGPWKFTKIIPKAHRAIELPIGTIRKSGTETGDILMLDNAAK